MGEFVKVAMTDEIRPGEKKLVEVDGEPVAIFNLDGTYYAIQDVCTHDGGPLAEGEMIGEEVECPRHGARFNIRTGAVTRMPACEPVETYPVKVEGDQIFVSLD
ncbi:MAG: non-heme iron oxygenase ferredoxin subunit [Nitrospinota bacterium]